MHWTLLFKHKNLFSCRGALLPWPPPGAPGAPWTPTGASAPRPNYRLALLRSLWVCVWLPLLFTLCGPWPFLQDNLGTRTISRSRFSWGPRRYCSHMYRVLILSLSPLTDMPAENIKEMVHFRWANKQWPPLVANLPRVWTSTRICWFVILLACSSLTEIVSINKIKIYEWITVNKFRNVTDFQLCDGFLSISALTLWFGWHQEEHLACRSACYSSL